MRILYINAADISDCYSGPVVHILETVHSFSRLDAEVHLFCQEPTGEPAIGLGNVILRTSKTGRLRLLKLLIHTLRALIKESFDLVYFRADWRLASVCVLAKILGIPFVVESNGIPTLESPKYRLLFKQPWLYLADRWVYRNGLVVFPVTEELGKFIREKYSVKAERIEVISNGVNTEHYIPLLKKDALFDTGERPSLGFLGNICPWQGLKVMIDALPHIIKDIPDLLVLIGGQGVSQKSCEKKAKELGIDHHIQWVGPVSYKQSPRFVASCDVMVAPLLENTRNRLTGLSPLKLFMYMSCAKPFLVPNLTSLNWLETIQNCIRFKAHDPVDLAQKCIQLLKLSTDERNELGMSGRRIAVEKYDWDIIAGYILNIIQQRLDNRTSSEKFNSVLKIEN
jgi:glycosyltransferase involved in cell wall biosynthesis